MLTAENLVWRTATVRQIVEETPRVCSLDLEIPGWAGHLPGQHVDIRLSAGEGVATRSYSIASAPETPRVRITAERGAMRRFSRFLANEFRPGDTLELRGPIGDKFVWNAAMPESLFLIAAGSGIVPLMSMLQHREASSHKCPALLIYSSSTLEDIIYRAELERLVACGNGLRVVHTLTRQKPPGWRSETKRLDREMLSRIGFPPSEQPRIYICGATNFASSMATALAEIGHPEHSISLGFQG